MTGKLPLFFKETIGPMLNLCLTVYNMVKTNETGVKAYMVDGYVHTQDLHEPC